MPTNEEVMCPTCGGRTWDNRLTKKNPAAPDYKCRDRGCDGVVWPARGGNGTPAPAKAAAPSIAATTKQAVNLGPHIPGLDSETGAPPADYADVGETLVAIFKLHRACFDHALNMANVAYTIHRIQADLSSVSALTAQTFIAAMDRGLSR